MNQRGRRDARRTVADPVCRRGGAPLNIEDDDLAVGGDEIGIDHFPLRAIVAPESAEPLSWTARRCALRF